jgi:hypothetical protein
MRNKASFPSTKARVPLALALFRRRITAFSVPLFVISICACHARDQGSIPCVGVSFLPQREEVGGGDSENSAFANKGGRKGRDGGGGEAGPRRSSGIAPLPACALIWPLTLCGQNLASLGSSGLYECVVVLVLCCVFVAALFVTKRLCQYFSNSNNVFDRYHP